ncbi:MAG: hypothetical protein SGPRY_012128 [Prymnesium sp.]
MREFFCSHEIPKSAEEFWSYRLDLDFDRLIAEADGQVVSLVRLDNKTDEHGHDMIDRDVRLTFKNNPVPKTLRSMLKDPEFAFNVTACWYKTLFDEAHAMVYSIKLPVFSDRISVNGQQWAEPISSTRCRLCCRVWCSVTRLPGISTQVAKGIEGGMQAAYKLLPKRVEEFAAFREKKLSQRISAASLTPTEPQLADMPPQAALADVEEQMSPTESAEVKTLHDDSMDSQLSKRSEELRRGGSEEAENSDMERDTPERVVELGLPHEYEGMLIAMRQKQKQLRLALQQAEREAENQELYELRKYITENKKLRRELEEEREESSALRRRLAAAEKALAQVGP